VLHDILLITLALSLYDSSSDMSKSRPFPASESKKFKSFVLIKISIKMYCLISYLK